MSVGLFKDGSGLEFRFIKATGIGSDQGIPVATERSKL